MERRVRGGAASRDAAAGRDSSATGRDFKRESVTTGRPGATAVSEENWSALSNLRVAAELEDEAAQAQAHARPGSTRPSPSAGGNSSRSKVRRTSSSTIPSDPDRVSKSSLSFILDDQASSAISSDDDFTSGSKRAAALITRSKSTGDLTGEAMAAGAAGLRGVVAAAISPAHFTSSGGGRSNRLLGSKQGADGKRRARRPPSRICKHEGCEQYVVDQGLCVRHGGGKRCLTEGCTSRAKHQGRCWRHGGSTECKVPSCINRAKSRGFCWSHGGGTKCKFETCEKIAISNGLCWAHGGGKRCSVKGCMRQAYERTDNLCNNHYQEQQHGAVEGEEEASAPSSWHPDDEEKPAAPLPDQ